MPGKILISAFLGGLLFTILLLPDSLSGKDADTDATTDLRETTLPVSAFIEPDNDLFEGTLHYLLKINGSQQELRYRIRRGLIRLEIDDPHMGGSMTVLISPKDDRMVLLIHNIHAFTELALHDMTGHSETFLNNMDRITKTGNQQEIAGIENHEYVITTDNGDRLQFWSPLETSRYGLFQFPEFVDRFLSNILTHDLPNGFFPFSILYQGDRSTVEISLIHIEEEKLDIDLFAVPANYRKLSITVPEY